MLDNQNNNLSFNSYRTNAYKNLNTFKNNLSYLNTALIFCGSFGYILNQMEGTDNYYVLGVSLGYTALYFIQSENRLKSFRSLLFAASTILYLYNNDNNVGITISLLITAHPLIKIIFSTHIFELINDITFNDFYNFISSSAYNLINNEEIYKNIKSNFNIVKNFVLFPFELYKMCRDLEILNTALAPILIAASAISAINDGDINIDIVKGFMFTANCFLLSNNLFDVTSIDPVTQLLMNLYCTTYLSELFILPMIESLNTVKINIEETLCDKFINNVHLFINNFSFSQENNLSQSI